MLEQVFANVRKNAPLVHCITNYVTVNDVANMLLASGASPIMADDAKEVEEITSICSSLVINIGTLNERTIESMILAGKKANERGIPVILDPVGVGASTLRTETALRLLAAIQFSVIRGNSSEIKTLSKGNGLTKGVDAAESDRFDQRNMDDMIKLTQELSQKTGAIIVTTGEMDLVVDGDSTFVIHNGHASMAKITGSGCMLSAIIGAFCAANRENLLEAAAAAVSAIGICGELAHEKQKATQSGTNSFRMFFIDSMSLLTETTFKERMKIETK